MAHFAVDLAVDPFSARWPYAEVDAEIECGFNSIVDCHLGLVFKFGFEIGPFTSYVF